jgi:hypothetical protein
MSAVILLNGGVDSNEAVEKIIVIKITDMSMQVTLEFKQFN